MFRSILADVMHAVPISNPPNPWASTEVQYLEESPPEVKLEVFEDHTRNILAKNDSPDVGFTYSVNPYRGCFHACAYCYARPSHEYLSLGAGTDFDRKIMVKLRAPELLRAAFAKRSWKKDVVVFSGVTDCYQPLEASYRLTRGCLEVCAVEANPAAIITKAPLCERDVDVLQELARVASVHVTVSIPIWDVERARAIEPYVATPLRRMRIIETLARAGVEVGVNVAPIIPGLNDEDIPKILSAARDAGATHAGSVLLRLPGSVKMVFEERLRAGLPLSADRVLHRIRETRGGQLYDSRFGARGRGEGTYALAIQTLFQTWARKLGFASHLQGRHGQGLRSDGGGEAARDAKPHAAKAEAATAQATKAEAPKARAAKQSPPGQMTFSAFAASEVRVRSDGGGRS